jgi:hypothetical protein
MGRDIIFYVYLHLLFFGLGWWVRFLLPARLPGYRFYWLSCAGVATAAILGQILYFQGISVPVIARIFWVAGVLGLIQMLWTLKKHRPLVNGRRSWGFNIEKDVVILCAGTLLLLFPRLTGGQQFSIFEGNHIDTFNYLESAFTYVQCDYSFLRSHSPIEIVQAGGYTISLLILECRPAVSLLYGIASQFNPSYFVQNHYTFLCYFFSISLGMVTILAGSFAGVPSLLAPLLAICVIAGFWGQYVLDINAWSQCASLPLVLSLILLVIRIPEPDDGIQDGVQRLTTSLQWILFSSLLLAGSVYLYPEAVMYFIPAFCGVIVLRFWRERRWRSILGFLGIILFTVTMLIPCWNSTCGFVSRQGSFALGGKVDWWKFFDKYLVGRDGLNSAWEANLMDGLAGVLGGYFLTPSSNDELQVQFIIRLGLVALLVGVGMLVIRSLRRKFSKKPFPQEAVWLSVVLAILLVQTLVLLMVGRIWAAGKGLSFSAPLMMIVVLSPVLELPRKGRSPRDYFGMTALVFLSLSQLGFALARPIFAARPSGIHYEPPYPGVSGPQLKTSYDWGDFTFIDKISPDDYAEISIENPWVQSYAKMILRSHKIDCHIGPPIYVNRDSKQVIGVDPPKRRVTVKVEEDLDWSRKIKVVTLKTVRVAPSTQLTSDR